MEPNQETSDEDTIGARIVQARERAGFSTAQLARRLGVKTRTLAGWERDETDVRTNRLLMLAQMLDVSTLWLLEGEDRYAPEENLGEDRRIKGQLETIRRALIDLTTRIDDLSALVDNRPEERDAA